MTLKRERKWWFSSPRMTVFVRTLDDIIVECAPIVRKFKGQHIKNLANWMRGKEPDKFKYSELPIVEHKND